VWSERCTASYSSDSISAVGGFSAGITQGSGKAGNFGLASARSSRGFQPAADSAVAAASLRSVLASMSDEELLRYKAAFQNADQDEDGYLDVAQAMRAMQSCGVAVSGNAMLDSLDDLEVAQEGDMRSSEWELEQGRRRRRRRRNSLAELETEVYRETGRERALSQEMEEHNGGIAEDAKQTHPLSARGRRSTGQGTTLVTELDKASSHSSLRSPSIDISTFLSLLNRRATEHHSPAPFQRRLGGGQSQPTKSLSHPSSRNPLSSPPVQPVQQQLQQQPQQQSESWQHNSYQSSDTGTVAPSPRPHGNVSSGFMLPQQTSSPRLFPSLRLRDHSASESRMQISSGLLDRTSSHSGNGSGTQGGTPKRAASGGVTDLLDDEDDDFNPEADLLAAFYTFDPSHSGSMSVAHLAAILQHMGEKWSEEEVQELIEEVDPRGEGRINYRQLAHKVPTAQHCTRRHLSLIH
jgi:Ca2+-binding EF-hand superfamily protein